MSNAAAALILVPFAVTAATLFYFRGADFRRGPFDRWKALAGLVSLAGTLLVGTVPGLWPLWVIAAPAFMFFLARTLGFFKKPWWPAALYAGVCVALSPVCVACAFLSALLVAGTD
jgi:hypothetical protein